MWQLAKKQVWQHLPSAFEEATGLATDAHRARMQAAALLRRAAEKPLEAVWAWAQVLPSSWVAPVAVAASAQEAALCLVAAHWDTQSCVGCPAAARCARYSFALPETVQAAAPFVSADLRHLNAAAHAATLSAPDVHQKDPVDVAADPTAVAAAAVVPSESLQTVGSGRLAGWDTGEAGGNAD